MYGYVGNKAALNHESCLRRPRDVTRFLFHKRKLSLDRSGFISIILSHPLGTVAAGLATAACIMGILCLPVLLILVYRQRQITHSGRR